jgi:signal transduction histidine kinase
VYIANSGSLLKASPGALEVIAARVPQVDAIHRAPDGGLWLGSPDGLRRLTHDRLEHVAVPEQLLRADVQTMTSDREGALWIAVHGHGLYRLHAGAWQRIERPELPDATPSAAFTDTKNRVWFGYPDGSIAVIDAHRATTFAALGIGPVMGFAEGTRHIWAAADLGLAQFDGTRMQVLHASKASFLNGISGVVELDDTLWLNGLLGVARTPVAEIEAALRADTVVRHELFDARDGLPGVAQQASPVPTLVLADDGRLWLATNHGVVWIDPRDTAQDERTPRASIRSITAGPLTLAPGSPIVLPKRTTGVRIDYTALNLSVPERTRFAYRLAGVDELWRDAGTRREAFYTNLAPGAYRFELRAANGNGAWSDRPATLEFAIEPAFVQTPWFTALCIGVALALTWIAYRLHLRQVTSRLRARLEERLTERERIARELHDTLLQGVQGLILRFQAATQRIPDQEPARRMMEEALDRADEVLVEGRDRVQDLRSSTQHASDLPQALALAGEGFAQPGSAQFRVVVEGTPRPLHPIARDEAYRIGAQALANAFRHARAQQIEVEIVYSRRNLQLRFRDDGCGIDQDVLKAGRRGHFGLAGMRERAHKLRAHLAIWSRPGAGTEIEVRIPASIAYARKRGPWWTREARS